MTSADECRAGHVELVGVHKRFGPGSAAGLDLPDLRLPGRKLTSVLGPSGCGKTTLLRLLAGLERVDQGRILLDGMDITETPASARDVSQVAQNYALFPHLTVLDNVAFGLLAQRVERADALAQARQALSSLGLSNFESRMPGELSGGQQQRVAIARALVVRPRLLLFDEPLSNLDARLRRQIREDIRALQQRFGLTVVYVTHDAAEALAVSDCIVVLNQGRVVQSGSPREIYERPVNEFVARFVDDTALFDIEPGAAGRAWLGPLEIPLPRPPGQEGPIRVAIRADAWFLLPPSESGLPGTVLRAAYQGASQEVQVRTDVGVLTLRCHAARHLYQSGAPVTLRLRDHGVALLPPA